jgi:D-alanyl-D-alanine carboxypeptidase
MASTTKIMTALVALESGDVQRTVQVSAEAIGIEGSSVYLYKDEKLTLEDLLYAMMLESANDAAAAIAIEVGGSIDEFADMMNKKADELGLKNTHFENPHGLDCDSHYTTARELAKIAHEAMKNESFRSIVSTFKKTIPLNESEGVRLLINHNKMLKGYDGAVGIKTGFTKKSGRCLVSAAERDGVKFICVTLNAPDDWRDHTALLNYGFSLYEGRPLDAHRSLSLSIPVINGTKDSIALSAQDDYIILPKNSPMLNASFEINRFAVAPVKQGAVLGIVRYTQNGMTVATVPLHAEENVEALSVRLGFWDKIKNLLNM